MRATLVHGDGKIILVQPNTKELVGLDMAQPGSLYTQHVESGQAANILAGTAFTTGDQRMSAWRTIRPASLHMDKPLMISINRDLAGIFALWRRDTYMQGGLYGAIILIMTLGLFVYQRRMISQDRLAAGYEAERKQQETVIKEHNALLTLQKAELEATLSRVKRLEGTIPICMHCKKIRSESSDWHQLERYIGEHSDAVFSHGICPQCLAEQMKKLD